MYNFKKILVYSIHYSIEKDLYTYFVHLSNILHSVLENMLI